MKRVIAAVVALAMTTGLVWAQQQRSPLLIVRNSSPLHSGAILVHVYAVPSRGPGGWGADLLGAIVVSPASTIGIFLTAGVCEYDVRLVFDNGFSAERRSVDVCSGGQRNVVDVNGGVVANGRGRMQ